MPANVTLYTDAAREVPAGDITLGEMTLPYDQSFVDGEPQQMFAKNTGTTTLRDFAVALDGEGAKSVQLARDEGDRPGVWAAPGESILTPKFIGPGEEFSFWARGQFSIEDHEGEVDFEFVFRGVSVG